PSTGVANDIAIGGLGEKRALPKCGRKRRKTERHEEALAVADHAARVGVFRFQNFGEVITWIGVRRSNKGINVGPILRPHIAQEVRGNGSVPANDFTSVLLCE